MRGALGLFAMAIVFIGVGCGSSQRCDLVLRATPTAGERVTAAGMQTARDVIVRRLQALGVAPNVVIRGHDEIVVQFARARELAKEGELISQRGEFDVYDLEADLAPVSLNAGRPAPFPTRLALLAAAGAAAKHGTVVSCPTSNGCLGAGAHGNSKSGTYWYLFSGQPAVTPDDLVRSEISAQLDPNTNIAEVQLGFTRHGEHEFQQITRTEFARGQERARAAGQAGNTRPNVVQQYVQHSAIVLDGVLESTPYIDYTAADLAPGIPGPAVITMGSGGVKEAQSLALILRSGPLPYSFGLESPGCSDSNP